ncbi:MAG: four helix bundle protein [Pseudomonadota bacterium]
MKIEIEKLGILEIEKSDNILSPDFVTSYKQLKVFQKSYKLAIDIHKYSLGFPKIEQYALADQLRRASKSICANIAEGFTRQRASKLEWKRFLLISASSAEESRMWVDFSFDLNYISDEIYSTWQNELDNIINMLHKMRAK